MKWLWLVAVGVVVAGCATEPNYLKSAPPRKDTQAERLDLETRHSIVVSSCSKKLELGIYTTNVEMTEDCVNPAVQPLLAESGMQTDLINISLAFALKQAEAMDSGAYSRADILMAAAQFDSHLWEVQEARRRAQRDEDRQDAALALQALNAETQGRAQQAQQRALVAEERARQDEKRRQSYQMLLNAIKPDNNVTRCQTSEQFGSLITECRDSQF